MTTLPFTLADYADRILTPALLAMLGLPDTEEGRLALDEITKAVLAADQ